MQRACRRPRMKKVLVILASIILCVAVLVILCGGIPRRHRENSAAQVGDPQGEPPSLRGTSPSALKTNSTLADVPDFPAWCRFVPDLFRSTACGSSRPSPFQLDPVPPSGGRIRNRTAPAWCDYVPSEYQDGACRGSGAGCTCSDWCSATPLESQQWNAECCACQDSRSAPAAPKKNDTKTRTVPSWCQFVPSELQKQACRESGPGCKCSEWCSATPSWSREWNPECCGCTGNVPAPSPPLPPRQDATQNGTMPAWCHFIPEDLKAEACHGSSWGCKCSDWCSATPPFSRQWNSECCGCKGTTPQASQNGTRQGMLPAWCHFIPGDFKSEACKGSGPGCKCSSWCKATPLTSRQWNTECCGCGSQNP